MRTPLLLFALGLLVHAGWALTLPSPIDWDPAYYLDVARHIAAGDGALSGAVWNLGLLPDTLPAPADMHWMPLPSRVLVPAMLLWPAHGAQLATVLLAALWAPLAWGTARALDLGPRAAALAGLFAAFGGGYARFLSTPDSIALFGLVGGLGVAFALRRAWLPVAILAALAALTRGDAFLLGLCLALAFRGWRRLVVAAAGPLATGAWYLRDWLLGGGAWLASRDLVAHATSTAALMAGGVQRITLADRLVFLARTVPELLVVAALIGVFILPLFALAQGWRLRRRPGLVSAALYALLVLIVPVFAAPAVGASGTPFRSWSALFPLLCALGAAGILWAGRWGARHRGYPAWFLPGLLGAGVVIGSVALGATNWRLGPQPDFTCAQLPPGPLLAADPLMVSGRCGLSAVVLPRQASADTVLSLARRYGIVHAFLAAPDDTRADYARPQDAARLLPGWERVSERVYRRP